MISVLSFYGSADGGTCSSWALNYCHHDNGTRVSCRQQGLATDCRDTLYMLQVGSSSSSTGSRVRVPTSQHRPRAAGPKNKKTGTCGVENSPRLIFKFQIPRVQPRLLFSRFLVHRMTTAGAASTCLGKSLFGGLQMPRFLPSLNSNRLRLILICLFREQLFWKPLEGHVKAFGNCLLYHGHSA